MVLISKRITGKPFLRVDFERDHKLNARQPRTALIRQAEYKHDTVLLTFRDAGIARRRYRRGKPAAVAWGWGTRNIEKFYGYVHSSKLIKATKTEPAKLEVYLVGASFRMNKPRMRSFRRLNVVALVRSIAVEHRFSLRADPSARFIEHTPQLGRSDWAMIVRAARDIGYTASCRRTEVQFKQRTINMRPTPTNPVPTLRFSRGYGGARDTLFKFRQSTTDTGVRITSNTKRIIGGVDVTGKPFWSLPEKTLAGSDDPVFSEYVTNDVVNSMSDAKRALSGLNGLNRFFVAADVEFSGVSKLRCGETVRFTNVPDEVLGFWWVGIIEHHLSGRLPGRPETYRCTATVGRDSVVQPQPAPGVLFDEPSLDPDGSGPEVPTIFNPDDDCAPIDRISPPTRSRDTRGSLQVPPLVIPRLDRWAGRTVHRGAPRKVR